LNAQEFIIVHYSSKPTYKPWKLALPYKPWKLALPNALIIYKISSGCAENC